MVKSSILALICILSPLPMGTWEQTTGERIRVPCPSSHSSDPYRLPGACVAPAPAVCMSPAAYVYAQEESAKAQAQIEALQQALAQKERALAQIERDYETSLAEAQIVQSALTPLCTSECSTFKPALIGSALGFSTCAVLWGASQWSK